ncbi:type II toxin-antitoxin system RelE/ParE family toxin [Bacteroides sp. 51]|uniref:type II toxin-antitoxin system RelE/ParE family toxin n=1 Tax=Bacteroides sp. 51 TaxID=2302938 RepID=UPI0013D64957|nr:type II toxin-antitoxin system RelE/ParE family toxin [Bacteroides sp. 51]NDV83870.1 type II toxin-antitoxin system RelE/ParE family toxin [Bacteroides sp. 51]
MEVKWEPLAEQQLENISAYYHRVAGLKTANRIVDKVVETVVRLAIFPKMGSIELNMEGLNYEYRSLVTHKHYKVVYRIENEIIYIFSVFDCRQDPRKMRE